MEANWKFKSLKYDIYINSFLKGKEKFSKSLQKLIDNNIVIDISKFSIKVK